MTGVKNAARNTPFQMHEYCSNECPGRTPVAQKRFKLKTTHHNGSILNLRNCILIACHLEHVFIVGESMRMCLTEESVPINVPWSFTDIAKLGPGIFFLQRHYFYMKTPLLCRWKTMTTNKSQTLILLPERPNCWAWKQPNKTKFFIPNSDSS